MTKLYPHGGEASNENAGPHTLLPLAQRACRNVVRLL